MEKDLEKIKRQKREAAEEKDRLYRVEHERKKSAPIPAKKELSRLLEIQSGHGDRVRAAIRDRQLGEQVVRENNAITREILELRERIKLLERY